MVGAVRPRAGLFVAVACAQCPFWPRIHPTNGLDSAEGRGKGGGFKPIRPDTCDLTHARMVSCSWRLLVTGGRNPPPPLPTAKRGEDEREGGGVQAVQAVLPWAQAASAPRVVGGGRREGKGQGREKEGGGEGGRGKGASHGPEAEKGCLPDVGRAARGRYADRRRAAPQLPPLSAERKLKGTRPLP